MGIDGLILLDNTGRPIIQSGFRSTPASYPLLHIDAFNNALSKVSRPSDVDPVIYVPPLNITEPPTACCHIHCGDVRFLCPIRGDLDPLFAFAFLQTFIDILDEYFDSISAITLKENFDVVYQLLEETLDSGGHPLTTTPNALRDIVLPPSLLKKLLSMAGTNISTTINSGSGLGAATGPFSSPIPWRKSGLKYTSNEIYFDMVEDLRAIVNKHGIALSSNVFGRIETNTRLSGTPDCILSFTNPNVMTDCAFHPCVRLQRWARDKVLSFIPPDGKFILGEYRYSPTAATSARTGVAAPSEKAVSTASVVKDTVGVPFLIKAQFDIQESMASFDIMFTSKLSTRPFDNVVVELNLGDGASGIKCIPSRATGGLGRGGVGSVDTGLGASWAFDSKNRVLRWEIPSIPPSSTWNLRGSFTTPSGMPRPSHALQIRFEIQTHTFSALKVDQMKVTGETYKPYKGVRGKSIGNVEWRW